MSAEERKTIIKNISHLGEIYFSTDPEITKWNADKLNNDWFLGLSFFLYHVFMRGRRDELSIKYCKHTISILKNFSDQGTSIEKLQDITQKESIYITELLKNKAKRVSDTTVNGELSKALTESGPDHLKNMADLKITLATLRFIQFNKEKNIFKYLSDNLKCGEIKTIYDKLDNLEQVGHKLASFVIRDVLLLTKKFKPITADYYYVFPIDTWVKQVIEILPDNNIKQLSKEEIEKLCEELSRDNIDILNFAVGTWLLGKYSLKISTMAFRKEFDESDWKLLSRSISELNE